MAGVAVSGAGVYRHARENRAQGAAIHNEIMRQGTGSRRGRAPRSSGKRGFNHGPNRSIESSGPYIKLRGTAVQVYDKYMALARDANSSGDRIAAENYYQHAEHYYRVMNANAGNGDGRRPRRGNGRDQDAAPDSTPAKAEVKVAAKVEPQPQPQAQTQSKAEAVTETQNETETTADSETAGPDDTIN